MFLSCLRVFSNIALSVSNQITQINRYTFVSILHNYYSNNNTMMVCTLLVRMFITLIIILNRVSLRCTQRTRRHTSSSSSVAPNMTSNIVSSGGVNVIYSYTTMCNNMCTPFTDKRVHICTYLCGVLTFYLKFDFLI